MGHRVLSATFLMTHISEEWLRNQKVVLPPRGASAGWRNGLTGTSGISTRGSANLCPWERAILVTSSWPRASQLKSSFAEKALGVLLDNKFNKRQQCALKARKVNGNDSRGHASLLSCDMLTLRLGCNHIKPDFKQVWNNLKSRESTSKDTRAVQFGSLPIGTVSQQMLHTFVVENRARVRKVAFWLLLVDSWSGVSQPFRERRVFPSELGKLCPRAPTQPLGWRGVRG